MTPTLVRPAVTIIEVEGGFGYIIGIDQTIIKQEHAPAVNGLHIMSETEATTLANYIADKIFIGLPWSVSEEQINSIWTGSKNSKALIDEEMSSYLSPVIQ